MVRYLVRAYAKSGREGAWQSYNPNGPSWYFETLRNTATKLENSYRLKFGKATIGDDQLTEQQQGQEVTSTNQVQVGEVSDTLLLKVLREVAKVDSEFKAEIKAAGEDQKATKRLLQAVGLPINGAHSFLKSWASWFYAGTEGLLLGNEEVAEEERKNRPLANDVVAEMSLGQRTGGQNGAIASNIRWALAKAAGQSYSSASDTKLSGASFNGQIVVPANSKWNFIERWGSFGEGDGYQSYAGTPGAGACDLATLVNSLTLRVPGLKPWHGEKHATIIPGFTVEESVNIWEGREATANLVIENTTGQDIVIYWKVEPLKVTVWSGSSTKTVAKGKVQTVEGDGRVEWKSEKGHVIRLTSNAFPQEFKFLGDVHTAMMDAMPINRTIVVEVSIQPGSQTQCLYLLGNLYWIQLGSETLRQDGADGIWAHEFGHVLQNELEMMVNDGVQECSCLQCIATQLGDEWVPEGVVEQSPLPANVRRLRDCKECGVEDVCAGKVNKDLTEEGGAR